jgi:hypothetical protein
MKSFQYIMRLKARWDGVEIKTLRLYEEQANTSFELTTGLWRGRRCERLLLPEP